MNRRTLVASALAAPLALLAGSAASKEQEHAILLAQSTEPLGYGPSPLGTPMEVSRHCDVVGMFEDAPSGEVYTASNAEDWHVYWGMAQISTTKDSAPAAIAYTFVPYLRSSPMDDDSLNRDITPEEIVRWRDAWGDPLTCYCCKEEITGGGAWVVMRPNTAYAVCDDCGTPKEQPHGQ